MFLIQGALALLGIAVLLWRGKLWLRASLILAAGILLFFTIDNQVARGGEWWLDPWWRNITLFLMLLLGMGFRVVWDSFEERGMSSGRRLKRRRLSIGVLDFVRPGLVSLIVFQGVLFLAKSQELSLELCLASFQNGFFWNSLFGRTRSAIENEAKVAASN